MYFILSTIVIYYSKNNCLIILIQSKKLRDNLSYVSLFTLPIKYYLSCNTFFKTLNLIKSKVNIEILFLLFIVS